MSQQDKSQNQDTKLPQLFLRKKESSEFDSRLRTDKSRISDENGEQTPVKTQKKNAMINTESILSSKSMKKRQLSVLKPPMVNAENIMNISASVGVSMGIKEDIDHKFKT